MANKEKVVAMHCVEFESEWKKKKPLMFDSKSPHLYPGGMYFLFFSDQGAADFRDAVEKESIQAFRSTGAWPFDGLYWVVVRKPQDLHRVEQLYDVQQVKTVDEARDKLIDAIPHIKVSPRSSGSGVSP